MKYLICIFLTFTIAVGCVKNSTPNPNQPLPVDSTSLVTSYSLLTQSNAVLTFDTIRYDQNKNIKSITHQFINDFGGGQWLDSGTFYFTMNASNTHPSNYTLIYKKYYQTEAYIEKHMLSYDDSNRIVLDSMYSTTSSEENIKGIHYTYVPGAIVLHIYEQEQFEHLDSILSISGNFAYFSTSSPDADGWNVNLSYRKEILPNFSNPFYRSNLSSSLGAFYIMEDNIDFLSKNLTTLDGFFYSWSTDVRGRILSGTARDGSFVKYTYL